VTTMRKHILLLASSSILAGGLTAPALAQEQTAEATTSLEAIVVTARRVSETLQEVPATVTVLTAQQIERAGIKTATDFVGLTPGVTIVANTAEAGDNQINIRGINSARDAESSVALIVDGILKTNTAVLNQNQGTVRQIEVLKGPQGAIYGRNAAAGAIVMTTLKPGDVLEGGIKASVAKDQTYSADAFISAPLGGNFGVVISGDYLTTDGFYKNKFIGSALAQSIYGRTESESSVDDREIWNVNARLVGNISDATEIDAKLRYGKLSGASINFNAAFALPAFGGAFYEDVNKHPFNYYSNIRPENNQETFEGSLKLEHDLGAAVVTAWVLYSNVKNDLVADGTSADFARYTFPGATPASVAASNKCFQTTAALTGFPLNPPAGIGAIPVPFIFAPANGSTFGPYAPTTCDGIQYQQRNQKDISAEIRVASNDSGAPLQWQFGGYYLNINRQVGVSLSADLGQGVIKNLYNGPNTANPTSQLYHDDFDTNVYAAFGNLEYDIADTLHAGVALRYDVEKRTVDNLVPAVFDPITGGTLNPGQTVVGGVVQGIGSKKDTFKQLQPKLTVAWKPNPDFTAFANWGIGFKSGGFNNAGSKAIVDSAFNAFIGAGVTINDNFRKEKSSAFEVGVKGNVLDGRVSYELSGYYTQVDDMQFFEFLVGGFGLLRVNSNIDKVDIKGIEASTNVRIIDGWSVFGSVNVTDSKIKKNASRPYTVGNKSPYTSDYTINLGSQIDAPLTDKIDLVMRADLRIVGPTWFHTVQDQVRPTLFSGLLPGSALGLPSFVGDANFDRSQRDTFKTVNLRIGLDTESWSITAFANNLLDEKYLEEVIPAAEFGGSFISPGARRSYGVEVGFKF
jgi:iron complex outermembrane recepter protein